MNDDRRNQLILGTAQLGMPYGIANAAGKPSARAAMEIVSTALGNGISRFDTAQAYGDSELVLGKVLSDVSAGVRITTKLPPNLRKSDGPALREMLLRSLDRLRAPRLHCLMLHREEHLSFLNGEFAECFTKAKEEGLVEKLGCSVYGPSMALAALRHPAIDAVQMPSSLFDRRFEAVGAFETAVSLGKELQIRSVLLQGILCLPPGELPTHLAPLASSVTAYHRLCRAFDLPPAAAAMGWMIRRHPSVLALFGAEKASQVAETPQNVSGTVIPDEMYEKMENLFPPQDDSLLNPSNWSK